LDLDQDFELANQHGKILPRNMPIRGDILLKLMSKAKVEQ
jgi:hypothetical protein